MAGMPIRRARRHYLPQNMAGAITPEFYGLEPAEQLRILCGATFRQAAEICSWDVRYLDSGRLALWNQVRHDIWVMMFRLGLEDRRSAEREKTLEALVKSMPRHYQQMAQAATAEHDEEESDDGLGPDGFEPI
jgi:hypothetical protein